VHDGKVVDVTEGSGTAPKLTVDFRITDVDRITYISFNGRYQGGASHEVSVQLYDWGLASWSTFGTLDHTTSNAWYSYAVVDGNDFISAEVCSLRFYHVQSGVNTHHLYLDYVSVGNGSFGGGITSHSALSGLDHDDHPQYLLDSDTLNTILTVSDTSSFTGRIAQKIDSTRALTLLGAKADSGITITAGNGLTGGGSLSANRTINVVGGWGQTVGADSIKPDTSLIATVSDVGAKADSADNATRTWVNSQISAAIPTGMIAMWSGTVASIPSGWHLCDGNAGTVDLRDKFVIGATQDDAGVAKTNVTGSLTQTGGSATFTPTGTVSQPTFSGSALANHNHAYGTIGVANHGNHTHSITSNVAVSNHSNHTHSVTSNVAVGNHGNHTHSVTSNVSVDNHANHYHAMSVVTTRFSGGTTAYCASQMGGTTLASGTTSVNTGNESATQTHSVTNNAVTSGNESATQTHSVTNNAVTSGNESATQTHSVTNNAVTSGNESATQTHTVSGSSDNASGGTPAGTVSQPTFNGSATNSMNPYYALAFIQKI
jgi:hypothetical protein